MLPGSEYQVVVSHGVVAGVADEAQDELYKIPAGTESMSEEEEEVEEPTSPSSPGVVPREEELLVPGSVKEIPEEDATAALSRIRSSQKEHAVSTESLHVRETPADLSKELDEEECPGTLSISDDEEDHKSNNNDDDERDEPSPPLPTWMIKFEQMKNQQVEEDIQTPEIRSSSRQRTIMEKTHHESEQLSTAPTLTVVTNPLSRVVEGPTNMNCDVNDDEEYKYQNLSPAERKLRIAQDKKDKELRALRKRKVAGRTTKALKKAINQNLDNSLQNQQPMEWRKVGDETTTTADCISPTHRDCEELALEQSKNRRENMEKERETLLQYQQHPESRSKDPKQLLYIDFMFGLVVGLNDKKPDMYSCTKAAAKIAPRTMASKKTVYYDPRYPPKVTSIEIDPDFDKPKQHRYVVKGKIPVLPKKKSPSSRSKNHKSSTSHDDIPSPSKEEEKKEPLLEKEQEEPDPELEENEREITEIPEKEEGGQPISMTGTIDIADPQTPTTCATFDVPMDSPKAKKTRCCLLACLLTMFTSCGRAIFKRQRKPPKNTDM